MSQLGAAQPALEPRSVALGGLAVEQQRQPFGVRQITRGVLRLQFDEGLGHAVELERSQLVESGMRKHC